MSDEKPNQYRPSEADHTPAAKAAKDRQAQATGQVPSIGRIVHYRLTADDAAVINRRPRHIEVPKNIVEHEDGTVVTSPAARAEAPFTWPLVTAGQVFPMIVTSVSKKPDGRPTADGEPTLGELGPDCLVNGTVFLDGADVFPVRAALVGDANGTYCWPTRV